MGSAQYYDSLMYDDTTPSITYQRWTLAEDHATVAERRVDTMSVQPLPPTLSAPLWSRKKTGNALAISADSRRLAVAGRHGHS